MEQFPTSFTDSLVGKESACNVGDPDSIPGSGRSPVEGIGYPLQYSWASLVAQLVKNPPAHVWDLGSSPGLGRSPGEEKAYHSSILAWRISPWGHKESDMTGQLSLSSVLHMVMYMFQCCSLNSFHPFLALLCPTSLFSVSASLFLPCK